jgi:hypothetical protein
MNLPSPKICRRIRQLFESCASEFEHEAASALNKLKKLLARHGLQLRDVPDIIKAADNDDAVGKRPQAAAQRARADTGKPAVNVLDLVMRLIELHVGLTPEQRMATALWFLHTCVFGRFSISPRLALLSPVRGCGKTTLLILGELLTADAYRSDNVTAAAIYYEIAGRERTLLIDEGDNLALQTNNVLRAVFNAGHRRGGAISRFVNGRSRKFPCFSPLAIAAIGTLPLPLMHRAIVINMQRHAPSDAPLQQLDEFDPVFPAARAEIQKWAATCVLNRDPEMLPGLHNRAADNWRVLLAVADDLGHGEAARAAATTLSANRLDEDIGIVLLIHVRAVFEALSVNRISSEVLVAELHKLDDGMWLDWRGPNDDRPPHKLTQSELARLLRNFNIRPRTIWPENRVPGAKSRRGYLKDQFEPAWRSYCGSPDTPTHPNKIVRLAKP